MSAVIELDGSPISFTEYPENVKVSNRISTYEDHNDRLSTKVTRKGRGFNKRTYVFHDGVRSQVGKFEQYQDPKDQGSSSQAQHSIEGWIVLVTNVHEEATEEDVMDKFCEYGRVKNLQLSIDRRTGYVKGYVLIAYDDYDEARCAIEKANGSKLLGQKIHCDFAFVKPPPLNHDKKKKSLRQRICYKDLSPPNRRRDRSRSPRG